jgi:hypothetical protein
MRAGPLVLLLLALPARASERPWAAAALGGATVPIPSNRVTTRGTLALSLERLIWRRIGLRLGVQVGQAEISTDLGVAAGPTLRLLRLRRLRLRATALVGYSAMHVHKHDTTLWTGALALSPGLELAYRLGRLFELRAAPLCLAFYWNELWLAAWTPGLGLAVTW